jgi:hypothetical protein
MLTFLRNISHVSLKGSPAREPRDLPQQGKEKRGLPPPGWTVHTEQVARRDRESHVLRGRDDGSEGVNVRLRVVGRFHFGHFGVWMV